MSSTPAERFITWLQTYADTTGYTLCRGMWVESDANSGKKYIAVFMSPGRSPVAGVVQYPLIDVIVTGTRNGRAVAGQVPAVEQFAYDIIEAAIENSWGECIAYIEPMGGIAGPKYTDADRPTYSMKFQLIT
jgi:hypothetical protein